MRRRDTVEVFLYDASKIVEELEKESWVNSENPIPQLSEVKLFNALTYLKKCLESISGDIYEATTGTKLSDDKKAAGRSGNSWGQFPYGLIENDFRSTVGSRHPRLRANRPDLYNLLESIQPYKLGRTTIYDLCTNRNIVEHDTTEQNAILTNERRINVNGLPIAQVSGGGSITFTDSTFNGRHVPFLNIKKEGTVDMVGDKSLLDIKNKVSYNLPDSNAELISLLKDAYTTVEELKNEVYKIL